MWLWVIPNETVEKGEWEMNQVYDKVKSCYESVRRKTDFVPEVAIVLGSGLGDYAEEIHVEYELPYRDRAFPCFNGTGTCGEIYFWLYR